MDDKPMDASLCFLRPTKKKHWIPNSASRRGIPNKQARSTRLLWISLLRARLRPPTETTSVSLQESALNFKHRGARNQKGKTAPNCRNQSGNAGSQKERFSNEAASTNEALNQQTAALPKPESSLRDETTGGASETIVGQWDLQSSCDTASLGTAVRSHRLWRRRSQLCTTAFAPSNCARQFGPSRLWLRPNTKL